MKEHPPGRPIPGDGSVRGDEPPADSVDLPSLSSVHTRSRLEKGMERLWVAVLQAPWASLVVVPAGRGVSGLAVARELAAAGSVYRGEPVEVLNAEGTRLSECRNLLGSVTGTAALHSLVIAVDCPLLTESARLLARAAQAAVLLVPIGTTPLADARRVVEAVGRDRFLGAVTLVAEA